MKKVSLIMMIIFFSIFVMGLIVGIPIYMIGAYFNNNYVETEAYITDVKPYVQNNNIIKYESIYIYRVDKTTYSNKYVSNYYDGIGTEIYVFYNEKNPEKSTREHIGILAFFGMAIIIPGFAFFISGVACMIIYCISSSKDKKRRNISVNGEKILAEYQGTERVYYINMTFSKPSVIVCKGIYNGEERIFKSQWMPYNPASVIKRKNITHFPVYVDKNDPTKYYMSIDELK